MCSSVSGKEHVVLLFIQMHRLINAAMVLIRIGRVSIIFIVKSVSDDLSLHQVRGHPVLTGDIWSWDHVSGGTSGPGTMCSFFSCEHLACREYIDCYNPCPYSRLHYTYFSIGIYSRASSVDNKLRSSIICASASPDPGSRLGEEHLGMRLICILTACTKNICLSW